MHELRRSRDKKILGVAGGFAEYFDMDKTVWRAIWVFLCVAMPPAILAYFILGMLMPEAPAAPYQPPVPPAEPAAPPFEPAMGAAGPEIPPMPEPPVQPGSEQQQGYQQPGYQAPPFGAPAHEKRIYKQLTKSRDRWLAGVCGGVADYFGVDPVLVRALWLASIFVFGTGLLLYIVLAILMPEPHRSMR